MNQNSIMVVKPYRWEGMWVFDDDPQGDMQRRDGSNYSLPDPSQSSAGPGFLLGWEGTARLNLHHA
jgi:hypothetical protein